MSRPVRASSERIRPLRVVEYDQMVQMGWFEDERIELLQGALVEMSPQGAAHAAIIRRLHRILSRALGDRALVSVQAPLAISSESEPEPDIAVVPVAGDDYESGHPTEAYLVVEVSDSSLDKDRNVKSRLYARAGIVEYWIVNLTERQIEVRTDPGTSDYESVLIARAGDTITLVELGDTQLDVSDILPET